MLSDFALSLEIQNTLMKASAPQLAVPATPHVTTRRAFCRSLLQLWISLPFDTRNTDSLKNFTTELKSHLFTKPLS